MQQAVPVVETSALPNGSAGLTVGVDLRRRPEGGPRSDDAVDPAEQFELLVASVHSHFDQPADVTTRRLIAAIEHPLVNIVGHPTTRSFGRRPPVRFDVDAVFAAAARTGTALEINAFPDRLDLDDTLARRAREHGVVFAIDTDAHSVLHLDHMRFGVATAQRGWVEARQVATAGVSGLAGLLLGSRLADRVGRRATSAVAMIAMALLGVLTYSGSRPAVVTGYVLGVLAASTLAPAAGALANELFPTSVRASVAGWLVVASVLGAVTGLLAFGAIADAGNRFALAAGATFLPAVGAIALFTLLPETRGREPEDLWPERPDQ